MAVFQVFEGRSTWWSELISSVIRIGTGSLHVVCASFTVSIRLHFEFSFLVGKYFLHILLQGYRQCHFVKFVNSVSLKLQKVPQVVPVTLGCVLILFMDFEVKFLNSVLPEKGERLPWPDHYSTLLAWFTEAALKCGNFLCLNFSGSGIPQGYHAHAILGFVEELVVNDDPEYKWIDKIRTPRASNEARQTLFSKLSGTK